MAHFYDVHKCTKMLHIEMQRCGSTGTSSEFAGRRREQMRASCNNSKLTKNSWDLRSRENFPSLVTYVGIKIHIHKRYDPEQIEKEKKTRPTPHKLLSEHKNLDRAEYHRD